MNKLIAALRRSPARAGGIAVAVAAVLIPAGLLAWGPDRPTYTYESPAPHVTFNSMTNAPYGDERNFVTIREAGTGSFGHEVNLQPGKEYEVQVYYHNNAASNLNTAENNYKGIATDAAMRVQMPATVKAGEKARITGVVSASNAQPQQVWDEAYGAAASDFALRYVAGSAKVASSNGAVNGAAMPDTLFTTGAPLGYDSLNGKLPGCNEFAGYVQFKFKVDQPNFTVKKSVAKTGITDYKDSMTSTAGATVDYEVEYKNTGTTQQSDVTIKDTLPKGVTYVAGSTHLATGKSGGNYEKISDNITTTGVNIGAFAPGANAFVKFSAKLPASDKLVCGENKLVNSASAITQNGQKSDTATVTITKECAPDKDIKVCDLTTNKVITIKEKDFDARKHSKNLDDCKAPVEGKIKVCDTTTKQIVTINEKDFDARKHSKNLADCAQYCEIPGKEHLPKDSADCVPLEMPETGMGGFATFAGIGLLSAGLAYAASSARLRKLLIG